MGQCTIKVRCFGPCIGSHGVVARLGVEVDPAQTCSLGECSSAAFGMLMKSLCDSMLADTLVEIIRPESIQELECSTI